METGAKHMDGQPALLTNARLCQARTRAGESCRCPAVSGKARCGIHGCERGSGAPSGEPNGAYYHGRFIANAIALQARSWAAIEGGARRQLKIVTTENAASLSTSGVLLQIKCGYA